MVDVDGPRLTGLSFFKLVGSGNDFVFLDGRDPALRALEQPEVVRRISDRRRGVGADGVVWLIPDPGAGLAYQMRYYNADGTLAAMCGNAALCSIALATRLGLAPNDRPFRFTSDAGELAGLRRPDGLPEVAMPLVQGVNLQPEIAVAAGEGRIGRVDTGVPHVVVEVPDVDAVDLPRRGAQLRAHPSLGSPGANVNFVSRAPEGRWRMRTFERGVEGETLACGTGAVASAALLNAWGQAAAQSTIITSSGLPLLVTLAPHASGAWQPSLAGEGRIVFEGRFGSL